MKKYASLAIGLLGIAVFLAVLYYHKSNPLLYFHSSQGASSEEAFQDQLTASSTRNGLRIPILIYHTVHPVYRGETLMQRKFNVAPDVFEKQLQYLQSHGYTTISLDQLVSDIKSGTTTPIAKPVVLTFDDGWNDQYTNALPLLMKYHDIATFYIYTNPIGRDSRFMTWPEIKDLQTAGMSIESHSVSHPYLSKLTPAQLHHELFDSKSILEEHLGTRVEHFASPFGYSSDALVTLLKEAGYVTGRTTYKGNIQSQDRLLSMPGYFAPQTLHDFVWIVGYAP